MAYDLVVIWESGEKNIYPYYTEDEAEDARKSMSMVFGNQISYSYTRRAY